MSNGTVEAVVEGEAEQVDKMIEWLEVGSPGAEVEKIVAREERPYGEAGAFNIRF